MYRKIFLLVFFSPISLMADPMAEKGVLDLRGWDMDVPVQLFGQWEFYYGEFLSPDSFTESRPPAKHFIMVPSYWNDYDLDGKILTGHGYATYRLIIHGHFAGKQLGMHIADMPCAYQLYVDGIPVASAGKPGTSRDTSVGRWASNVAYFEPKSDTTEIVLHISNYEHRHGGTWAFWRIGSAKSIALERDLSVAFDLFLVGSLLMMAFYHLGLFALRPVDRSTLYFGLFCLLTGIRSVFTGERIITVLVPQMPFELQLKIEYLTMSLGIPLFCAYLRHLYPDTAKWKYFIATDILCHIVSVVILITPTYIFNYTVSVLQVTTLVIAAIIVTVMVRTIRARKDGATPALAGMLFLLVCLINDIIYVHGYIQSVNLYPLGLFVFIFSQSFILSLVFARTFQSVERLSMDLSLTNDSYSRFVPREFLKHLKKHDIREIELGDQTEGEMTVLFSDIRSFTTRSEKMTPHECFQFLNHYLGRVTPIVRAHGGFIDKFIGDAIMAIFPDSPEKAVMAAVQMQLEVSRMNGAKSENPLQIGIGIHTGRLALGTIGDHNRMEGTVISDAVNLASRLQDLTKKLQCSIIVSETAGAGLFEMFNMRYMGSVRVKGKTQQTGIYAIDPEAVPQSSFR